MHPFFSSPYLCLYHLNKIQIGDVLFFSSSELKSGLTGGQVAGIVLGVICFFIIAAVIIYIARQRFQFGKFKSWVLGPDSGFDNALYKHHVSGKGDGSVEDNGLDQMSHDNSIAFGGNNAFKN